MADTPASPEDGSSEGSIRRRETVYQPIEDRLAHGRFEPGQRLGTRYRIVGKLGQGGMGEVYRADDLDLGQSVALKFLPEAVAADENWLRRFRNEVRTARQVTHPNVCRIYDIAEEEGHNFLSMEFIDGEDLSGVLRRLGRPSREKSIEIARQICLGLAAAHENGVLHRDLKPANIMIDGRGCARITDFGIAGFVHELQSRSARGGTPAYMAHEQLTDGRVSVRSDIYALGLILHELFTGQSVFDTDDVEELKRRHGSGSAPSSMSEPTDPAVERVIRRCLEHEPHQRPQSVYQVLAALPGGDPVAAALAAGETPSPEMIASARGRGGLRPAIALSLLGICAVAILVRAIQMDRFVPLPERGPNVLAVEAEQVMERLGYTDLPANSAWSFLPPSPSSAGSDDAAPRYRFFRRWSAASLMPSLFHNPYAVSPWNPPLTYHGDALVIRHADGAIERVEVFPEPGLTPLEKTDWPAVLELAGVDPATASAIEPGITASALEVRVWRLDDGRLLRAMAVNGRITAIRRLPAEALGTEQSAVFGQPVPDREPGHGSTYLTLFSLIANLAMLILAVHNTRLRRADMRGALRVAIVIMVLEFLVELLSVRPHEASLVEHAQRFFGDRAGGHIALHGVGLFIAYLGIEPYARRLWPRLLVGTMRLVSGRVSDPLVGREMLIGATIGIVLSMVLGTVGRAVVGGTEELIAVRLGTLTDTPRQLISILVLLAWGMVFAGVVAIMLVFGRIVLRHGLPALILAGVFVGLQFFAILEWVAAGSPMAAYALAALSGATFVATAYWSGLLSVVFAFAASMMFGGMTFSLQIGEWYSMHALLSAAFTLAMPAIGCRLALAGQPIFREPPTD